MYDIRQIDELSVGDRVSVAKTITEADGAMYIAATGDFGPVHVDQDYAAGTRFGERLAPGILGAGICTSVLTAEPDWSALPSSTPGAGVTRSPSRQHRPDCF